MHRANSTGISQEKGWEATELCNNYVSIHENHFIKRLEMKLMSKV